MVIRSLEGIFFYRAQDVPPQGGAAQAAHQASHLKGRYFCIWILLNFKGRLFFSFRFFNLWLCSFVLWREFLPSTRCSLSRSCCSGGSSGESWWILHPCYECFDLCLMDLLCLKDYLCFFIIMNERNEPSSFNHVPKGRCFVSEFF